MKFELNPKYAHLENFVKNLDDHFEQSTDVLFDKRNQIRKVRYEDRAYVIKSFRAPNWLNRFAYRYLRSSKAERSYYHSLKIGEVYCPAPIAFVEHYRYGLLDRSYYISDFFGYDFTIQPLLDDDGCPERKEILTAFADFTFTLHQNSILHLDYSLGNILIKKNDDPDHIGMDYEFKIIDVNRMRFCDLNINQRMQNFARLKPNDTALEIITERYAEKSGNDQRQLFDKAIYYRDVYAKKRELKNRIRGR